MAKYPFYFIGKLSIYIKNAWKRHTKYTQSMQMMPKGNQKRKRETTNHNPIQKHHPKRPRKT